MGDRANVLVRQDNEDNGVWLYTHWDGTELPRTLRNALIRGRERWDDAQYLTRIIFSEMVAGHEMALTGYGISSRVGDGDDRVLEVNVAHQTVSNGTTTWSFEGFIHTSSPTWHMQSATA